MGVILGARALLSIGTPQLWWWEPQDSKWILSNLNILSCQNGHNLTLGGRLTLCLRACVRVRSVGTGRACVRAVGCGSTRNTHTLPRRPPPPTLQRPPHTQASNSVTGGSRERTADQHHHHPHTAQTISGISSG
jgi:hypothetical protein